MLCEVALWKVWYIFYAMSLFGRVANRDDERTTLALLFYVYNIHELTG